jgi:hypothetical protein
MTIPLTSWKTTALGVFIGAMTIAIGYYQPGMSWKTWALGAGIALFGAVSKDFNVTGGTQPATAEAVSRTTALATLPAADAPAPVGSTGTISSRPQMVVPTKQDLLDEDAKRLKNLQLENAQQRLAQAQQDLADLKK